MRGEDLQMDGVIADSLQEKQAALYKKKKLFNSPSVKMNIDNKVYILLRINYGLTFANHCFLFLFTFQTTSQIVVLVSS